MTVDNEIRFDYRGIWTHWVFSALNGLVLKMSPKITLVLHSTKMSASLKLPSPLKNTRKSSILPDDVTVGQRFDALILDSCGVIVICRYVHEHANRRWKSLSNTIDYIAGHSKLACLFTYNFVMGTTFYGKVYTRRIVWLQIWRALVRWPYTWYNPDKRAT